MSVERRVQRRRETVYCRYCDHSASLDDMKKHNRKVHVMPTPEKVANTDKCPGCKIAWYPKGHNNLKRYHLDRNACPKPVKGERAPHLHGRTFDDGLLEFVRDEGYDQVPWGPALDTSPYEQVQCEIRNDVDPQWHQFVNALENDIGDHDSAVRYLDQILKRVQEAEGGSLYPFLQRKTVNKHLYLEYMPWTGRYFFVDDKHKLHELSRSGHSGGHEQASISHRTAALHGIDKADWERKINRRF